MHRRATDKVDSTTAGGEGSSVKVQEERVRIAVALALVFVPLERDVISILKAKRK